MGGHTAQGFHFAEGIIYVFSFFFVLYSMSSFLKSRKKEFGLLVMHGMTNRQLRTMVFLENVLIGLFATIAGIVLGIALSKLILLIAENALQLGQTMPFYFPVEAILLTFGAFLVLFIAISFFTVVVLRGNKLIDLIKGSTKPKTEPKASILLSLLAAVLLIGGYVAALMVKGVQVSMAMIPVTIIVIIGTYFLFTQLSVFLIRSMKRNRTFFLRKTNVLLLSDLAYRMKDNARTFFMVAIVSTVSFSAIGSLVGFKAMFTDSVIKENPFAFEYVSYKGNTKETEKKHLEEINKSLKEDEIKYTRYDATMKYVSIPNEEHPVMVVSESEFNTISAAAGNKQVDVSGDQTVEVRYANTVGGNQSLDKEKETLKLNGNEKVLDIKKVTTSSAFPSFSSYYVVSNQMFNQLKSVEYTEQFYAYDAEDWKATEEVGTELTTQLPQRNPGGEYQFYSLAFQMKEITQGYGAILFVGLFIGAVFFVASGSFLYFRLYTDLEDDKRKYAAIRKLGLTDKELSSVITKQISLLFFVPIGVALVHGAVALTALHNMFHYSLLKESAFVLGSFFLLQFVYFLIIRTTYIKNIKAAIG